MTEDLGGTTEGSDGAEGEAAFAGTGADLSTEVVVVEGQVPERLD